MKIRAQVSALRAASLASEARLDVGQSHIVGPLIAADRCPMAAMVIAAIDQQPAHAHLAHFAKGDFLRVSHGELLRFRSVGKHCFTRCYFSDLLEAIFVVKLTLWRLMFCPDANTTSGN